MLKASFLADVGRVARIWDADFAELAASAGDALVSDIYNPFTK